MLLRSGRSPACRRERAQGGEGDAVVELGRGDAMHHRHPEQHPDDRRAVVPGTGELGPSFGEERDLRPGGEIAGAQPGRRVGVAQRMAPDLVFERHPLLRRRLGDGPPEGDEPLVGGPGEFDLGGDHGRRARQPLVDDGEQQLLFRAEVEVERADGPPGTLGDRVDRCAGDALLGERRRSRGEQPLTCFRLAFALPHARQYNERSLCAQGRDGVRSAGPLRAATAPIGTLNRSLVEGVR